MSEPDWLICAREAQAIAQTGLAYCRDVYDRERYEQLRALASRLMAGFVNAPSERIDDFFRAEQGYATPKVDVRTAVFDNRGRVLLVREKIDGDRWTLPGGWADVNLTPGENALKELREESGYIGEIRKLAAVWDRGKQGHPPDPFSCVKMFFIADIVGGEPMTSIETSAIGWFGRHELPKALSMGRVLPHQLARMFDHRAHPDLPTDFD
ncbi:phosphohydrolase [Neoasaia chiangmaiensis NBRC 101099]|uniref:ADP-ribose pyrophosphatase n=1 Tax=Neoasaia chiangmaiensis TaxID=320497 RepID=A0A1U9KM22_9PROT|nr:NUDIX hydrolase [Neoasaia chiangmaiensis]AQS86842.1 ADP-ribose pyrophosphatase [Neoasaia chiangmaiensis]GBR37359.1 phosphohydrolase [Neoasaia chiangmaiensis NBRC 101099]GEN14914.1 putative ADP-ribose pyrophosphatase YjhB [Neoasaia chiangmaiensis]